MLSGALISTVSTYSEDVDGQNCAQPQIIAEESSAVTPARNLINANVISYCVDRKGGTIYEKYDKRAIVRKRNSVRG